MNRFIHVGGNCYINGHRFLLRTVNIFQKDKDDKKYHVTFIFDEKNAATVCYEYSLVSTSKFEARREVQRILNDTFD